MSLISTLKDQTSRTRSLAKALTWRITATLTTATIAYIVTGELGTAAIIGGIEFVLKFVMYYGHERAWNAVR
jgi:adenylylsulfate kinase|tara:strand:- start:4 stop:219 length:216 start_codon:yes stop_codon:yes gene_type:complete